uniref:Uncharacterized protein n=1 Tax=Panagrolaimus sp. ES5 TaxID=591445 RepID=A0AC34GSA0_9BILA
MSQSGSWSQNNNGGSIEISPIEVDLRSASDAPPRRSVQFSDKVQRFPESAPSSPKPTDASPTSKSAVNKTPLDIASESLKKDENVKKVDIPIQKNSDSESKNGNKPQIDSFIDVKMEKQNNPDLKIEFNSPLSNSSINFDQQQQQSDKQKQQQPQEEKDNFKPTPDVVPSSLNQPPHVKNENKNISGDFDDRQFVTTVILNVEMVRTPKETDPDDDWDTDTVKVAFSTNASNYETKTNEQKTEKDEEIVDSQIGASPGVASTTNTSAVSKDEQLQENKPPRSPQFGESKDGWNQIDLSPLLKTAPSTDIANINASLNRASSINEEEESTEVKKDQRQKTEDKKTEATDSAEIPIQVKEQSDVNPIEVSTPKMETNKFSTSEASAAAPPKDSNQTTETQFGTIPHKAIEIPIQFHEDKPVTPVDIPLSEFGIPSESTTEIIIVFDTQQKSQDDIKDSDKLFGTFPDKSIEIPIQHKGQPSVAKIDIPLSDFGIPSESSIEIAINFSTDADKNLSKNNTTTQKGIIEIPIQFEGQPTVSKVDIPLSEYGTPPLSHFEIPIIFAGHEKSSSSNADAKTSEAEITVIEIPIHFEGQEAPTSLKDKNYIPASETLTEIKISFENQNDNAQNVDDNALAGSLGIEIPIQFEGQPAVAKVDTPLSQHGTPALTTTEIPIIFTDAKKGDTKETPDKEEDSTEVTVIQFGFTAKKEDEKANASAITDEPSDISEIKQNEVPKKEEEKSDKSSSETHQNKIFEIPIQFEGQPAVQNPDIPLSEYGTPAETREEIFIIFETPDEKGQKGDNKNEDRFGLLHYKIFEIPIQMGNNIMVQKIDIPLSEFGFPVETMKEIPITIVERDDKESQEKEKAGNKFGILPYKVFEIAVQHEGKPEVEKVDIPLSEFGTPSESKIEIMIVFEDKQQDDDKEKVKLDGEQQKSVEADKTEQKGTNEHPNEASKDKNVPETFTEIPVSINSQNKQELNEQPKDEAKKVDEKTPESKEKMVDSPVLNDGQNIQQNTEIPSKNQESQGSKESEEEEKVTEIPITFDRQTGQQEFDQQPQTAVQPKQENEKASAEESRIIPITIERKPEQQSENDFKPKEEIPTESSLASQLDKQSETASQQLSQEQMAGNNEEKGAIIPVRVEKSNEQQERANNDENLNNLAANQQDQKLEDINGTIYQTSFAKPMVEEDTVAQKKENAEKVPEANDIKYQNSFAQPLTTERKEGEKAEEKSDNQNNYQSAFSKPATDENQQKAETKSQPEQTHSWNETPDQKISIENQDQRQEIVIPIKIESNQPSSATSQNETPKAESNKWESPKIDDQVESSLFSAPSPVNDEDFWIEVPASGVVHQIPISIQKTETPSNAPLQPSATPATQNQQSSLTNDIAPKDVQEKKPETSLSSVEQPKSNKDSGSNNYEVPDAGAKQQQQSRAQDSYNNQSSQLNDIKSNDTSNKNEEKSSNSAQPLDTTVRSPTKKYDDNSIELNIQEYEEQLRKNTQEALNLVDKLCESSTQQQQDRQAKRDREYERRSSQSPTNRDRSHLNNLNFSQLDAQSYRVNPDLMQDPTGAILLPDFRLALADNQFGLSIFNLHTKDLKRIDGGNKWRRPYNMIYLPRAKQFLVLCEYSEKEDGKYQLFVCRFSSDLEYINRVEAPIFIRDKEILTFRMAYCHRTDCLYLAASTFNTGYIYELAPDGFWREVYTGRNKTFVDISIFAVIGPVTELMLVDTSKDYIVVVSIYNSEAADTRRVAACEKPSALTIDEKGTVIIYDRCSCKVGIHSRLDNLRVHDITLVNHPKCQLSAWDRLLAVLIPSKKDLRLYKY